MYNETEKDKVERHLREQLWALRENKPIVTSEVIVAGLLEKWETKKQECFIVITLDGAHAVIKIREITKGTVNRALVHPREVFRPAIVDNAVSIIVAHNHPSGSRGKSTEDIEITKRLVEAGRVIGIQVLDHIIVTKTGYASFAEDGLI